MNAAAHRGTIFLEDAAVVGQQAFAGDQYVLRLLAPRCAAAATPGSFVHLTCDPGLPMRRPLSIMRRDANAGWIEVLYRIVGHGLAELAKREPGETLSCLGPIGRGFTPQRERPRVLMIGGGVGIPPMVFQAEALAAARDSGWRPLILMGSEIPFPFDLATSRHAVGSLPPDVTAAMPLMEQLGIPSRLASLSGFAGCYRGYVTALAETWLDTLTPQERAEVEILACGPQAMLVAVAALARRRGLPCQVSLEENMACAVGGCAGCTVLVQTPEGPAMKRVCVDGPVFDAATVVTLQ
ncbi:MAG: dihydroorotate dehydrogenase electron transfer subunit [Pseudomonadota bacterium]|nr:dihydroorotate dehydrogenase electron transfer subunit [Pseudomonadota bacterium]